MVIRSRRGASSSGCLLSLLLFVAALYYGVNIGEVYFRYYRLLDEMQTEAHLAAGLDDGTIRRRVQSAVDEIGIPDLIAFALFGRARVAAYLRDDSEAIACAKKCLDLAERIGHRLRRPVRAWLERLRDVGTLLANA